MNYRFKTNIKILTADQERNLISLAQTGDESAREEMILKNLKFVIKVAFEYKNIIDPEEIIGEGILGLNDSIDRFDLSRDLKFITFSVYWIRAYITQYLKDKKSIIRIPVNKQNEIRAAVRSNNITPEIQKFLNLKSRGVALDKPISGEGVSTFQDLLEDPDKSSRPDHVSENDTDSFVRGLLNRLPRIEKLILVGLFAFDGPKKTLRQLGEELKVSHERVRQLRDQALHRIYKYDDKEMILDNYLQTFGR